MARQIKLRKLSNHLTLTGWLDGPRTYLWFGDGNQMAPNSGYHLATFYGHRLYRLAKAIVRQFEEEK